MKVNAHQPLQCRQDEWKEGQGRCKGAIEKERVCKYLCILLATNLSCLSSTVHPSNHQNHPLALQQFRHTTISPATHPIMQPYPVTAPSAPSSNPTIPYYVQQALPHYHPQQYQSPFVNTLSFHQSHYQYPPTNEIPTMHIPTASYVNRHLGTYPHIQYSTYTHPPQPSYDSYNIATSG